MIPLQRSVWSGNPAELQELFSLTKAGRAQARSALGPHQFGWELRLTVNDSLIPSQVCRAITAWRRGRSPIPERHPKAAAIHDTLQWGARPDDVDSTAIAVGIETPRGVLVDTRLENGYRVFALNSKPLDRFHDRFTAGGAKDDRRDGHVVADALRTDRPRVSRRPI